MTYSWNEKALFNPEWPQENTLEKEYTFVTLTTGAVAAHDLLTVTGLVEMTVIAHCSTNLAGAATIELGTATTTAGILAQVANAEDIDAGDIWHDATVDKSVELTSVAKRNLVGEDVILTIGSTAITAGVITFYIRWAPISEDGNVVLA